MAQHKMEFAVGAGMVAAAFIAPQLEPMLATAAIRVSIAARVSAGSVGALKTVTDSWKLQSPAASFGQKIAGTAAASAVAARSSIIKNGTIVYAAVEAVIKGRISAR